MLGAMLLLLLLWCLTKSQTPPPPAPHPVAPLAPVQARPYLTPPHGQFDWYDED
jgi:hypothetical protein